MKIFVSSTIKGLEDLRDELYRRLKELGHTPWFSEKADFPTNRHLDAMTNCLKVAEECDFFVIILDKRAGLPYKRREGSPYQDLFGLPISEAEYWCARKKGKSICIFIRKKAENESAIYRKIKDESQRKIIEWYSEPRIYEFYDSLMHEKPHVPWRDTFDSIEEIMISLTSKIKEVQVKSSNSDNNQSVALIKKVRVECGRCGGKGERIDKNNSMFMNTWIECKICGGNGRVEFNLSRGEKLELCGGCKGKGERIDRNNSIFVKTWIKCKICNGTGWHVVGI